MSMLNMQCERLRDRADELRMLAGGMGAPYIVPETKETMALAMMSAASEMREAADTIKSLRDRLQDAEDARYDAGFKNGIKACLQQLDGMIYEGADVGEIRGWVDRQWEEEA